MRSRLSITRTGLLVSSILAVLYALVMFASLLLVGLGTTGAWRAALLGIGWSTVAGFEVGVLSIVIAGFAVAAVFVPVCNFILRLVPGRSKNLESPSQTSQPFAGSRSFRLLVGLLVLLPLVLLSLRLQASVLSLAITNGADAANKQVPDMRTKAMNMGHTINTALREAEPSFTADGRTMYFNCGNADICVSYLTSTWEEGNWTPPERLGAPITTEYEEVEPLINATGDKLYFNSNRPDGILKHIPFLSPMMNVFELANSIANAKFGLSILNDLGMGHVWVSYRINGVWSEPRNLKDIPGEPPVNSAFHDHCLSFSADGKEAFWTSTRPGGFGGNDIWTSRLIDGKWTAPENLGPDVNGPGDEHHSILTPDGNSLYVTSMREGGYGHEDIYVTTRDTDGKWGPLVNLGSQVNGAGDDRCPAWTPDLEIFLFDSVREGGFGGRDVWWMYSKDVPGYARASAPTGATKAARVPPR